MLPCSKETLAWFFYNASSSFFLLFLLLYFSSVLLADLFYFLYTFPVSLWSSRNGYEAGLFSEEEEEEEEEEEGNYRNFHVVEPMESDHLVADIICGGEALLFLHTNKTEKDQVHAEEFIDSQDPIIYEDDKNETFVSEQSSVYESLSPSDSEHDNEEDVVDHEETPTIDTDSFPNSGQDEDGPNTPITIQLNKSCMVANDKNCDVAAECYDDKTEKEDARLETNFTKDEKFLIFAPPQMETKKFQVQERNDDKEEIFGDSTEGSTSKSSSEWRSSINYRDSGTEDPFSSSSRRSCPKWESYSVFQKYDEEMTFLDRISAQKLHETESFNSFKVCPRSISERIVHKLATRKKGASSDDPRGQNPYHELEAAYVAQICLTWEALNWNYKNFQLLLASRREFDPGCPAYIAQQFQQFQVLLQRYVENEPYEHGKRPEIYARMRISAPKLLQVPEYRDSEDEKKGEGYNSRISSAAFLMIMEEGIRTFMNFLKADKEKHCQIIAAFFRKNRRGLVDPTVLHVIKKANTKKKLKLKDLRRARKCLRKRSRLKWEEEVEILLGLIDLEVVSRVLRMSDITEEQMHWCEDKMGKVKVWEGKLQRDSSPLFFPAH